MEADRDDLWDTLPDGVVIADADGVVEVVNAPARRLLGEAAVVGAALADVVALQDQEARDWLSVNRPYGGLDTRTGIPEQSWFLSDGTEVLVTATIRRHERRPMP